MKSLHGNANDEIVVKLHDELLLKVVHVKKADDVKDYKDSKSQKMHVVKRFIQYKLLHSSEVCI